MDRLTGTVYESRIRSMKPHMDLSPYTIAFFQTLDAWFGLYPGEAELAFWAMFVGVVCNTCCALLGCYLVLRRMSLLGDAISHAILPGLVVAFLVTDTIAAGPIFIGALVCGLLTALLTQTLHRVAKVPEDSSMGVVFTSLFALGVVLLASIPYAHIDQRCVFEGDIDFVGLNTEPLLGVPVPHVLRALLPAWGMTVLFIACFWKELKLSSFDPTLATAMGFSAALMHYLLMAMVAAVTVASFEAVGAILVVAMLIVPGATAHLLTDRLGRMMAWAVVVAVISAVGGYLLAYRLDTSVAGMMAVVAGGEFALAVFFAPRHGLLGKGLHNLRLSLRIVREDMLAMLYRLEERAGSESSHARIGNCVRLTGGGLTPWLAIPQLRWKGDVRFHSGLCLALTDQGRRRAQSLVRSHRLWEAYLKEHFHLPADHLHEPASRVEHYIGPALQDRLAESLAERDHDPHGQAIPPSPPEDAARGVRKQPRSHAP